MSTALKVLVSYLFQNISIKNLRIAIQSVLAYLESNPSVLMLSVVEAEFKIAINYNIILNVINLQLITPEQLIK